MAVFNPETATVKTRHAIAHAQAMTRELGHPELTSLHLLMAALQQEGLRLAAGGAAAHT